MNFQCYYELMVEMPHVYLQGSELPIDLEIETVPKGDSRALLRQMHRKLPITNRSNVLDELLQDMLFSSIMKRYFPNVSIKKLRDRLISLTS